MVVNGLCGLAGESQAAGQAFRHQAGNDAQQPGAKIAVFVDPQNPVDMAIDWIRTGQLGPPPPGATPGPGEPGARA